MKSFLFVSMAAFLTGVSQTAPLPSPTAVISPQDDVSKAVVIRPAAAAVAPEPPLLLWAQRLLNTARPGETRYQHKPSIVRLAGHASANETVVRTDCSGFLNALLLFAYGHDAAALSRWFGTKRPLARHYYETIVAERGFLRIESVGDVRLGDVLAVRYFRANNGNDTGHTMLVAGPPTRREPATPPVIGASEQWDVPIIDVTGKGHGKGDTRIVAHQSNGGIGRGVLRLYANEKHILQGYTWSVAENSAYYGAKERHLVVGRIKEGFQP